jgi:transposase
LDAANKIEWEQAFLDGTKLPSRNGGDPKTRPKELATDKAHDSRGCRCMLRQCGIKPIIPSFARPKDAKPKPGRPIRVGAGCHQRWKIERCFSWLDNCRRLVVRYDRHLHLYRSFCLLAIILWCVDRILK